MDVNDLVDAKLLGKTKFQRVKDDFLKQWNKPNVEMMKAKMWQEMSPAMKQELAKRIPDAVNNLNKRYGV